MTTPFLKRSWLSKAVGTLGLALSIGITQSAYAASADVGLSDDAVRASLELPVASPSALSVYSGAYEKDRSTVAGIGFYAVNPTASTLQNGVGLKVYSINSNQIDRIGLFGSLGGFVRGETAQGVGGELELHYAPNILTFMKDAKSMLDVQARLTYRVLQQANVFVGFNHGQIAFNGANIKFQDNFNIGFRMNF